MHSTFRPPRAGSPGFAAAIGAVALALAGCAAAPITPEEQSRARLDASVRCAAGETGACRTARVERYGPSDPWAAYGDPWYRERYYRDRYYWDRYERDRRYRGRDGYRDRWTDPWNYGDPFWNGHRWGAPGYWQDPRLGGGRHRRDPGQPPHPPRGPDATTPVPAPAPPPDASPPPDPPAHAPHAGAMRTRPPRTHEP